MSDIVDSMGHALKPTGQFNTFMLKVYEKQSDTKLKYLFSSLYNLPTLLDDISKNVEDNKLLLAIKVKIANKDEEVDYAEGTKEDLISRLSAKVIGSNDAMIVLFSKVNELAHFSKLAGILATAGFGADDNLEIKGFGFLSPRHERNPMALRALVDSADNHNTAFRDGLKKEYGIDITNKLILPR